MARLIRIQLPTSSLSALIFMISVVVVVVGVSDAAPTVKLGLERRQYAGAAAFIAHENTQLVSPLQVAMDRSRLRSAQFGSSLALASSKQAREVISPSGANSGLEAPLSAADSGADFVATLAMGTPPVSVLAIVDTGSSLVWRQCQPCLHCYPQAHDNAPIFDPALSSTYRTAPCNDTFCSSLPFTFLCGASAPAAPPSPCVYQYSYGNGADFTFGEIAYDVLTLPDTTGVPVSFAHFGFGCGHINHAANNFSGAGGIVGLGRAATSLISQLNITQFSYCLLSFFDSSSDSSPLFLGPVATGAISDSGTQVSTPILTNPLMPSLYYVKLEGISIGGKLLNVPAGTFELQEGGSGGFIIDSGTTITTLPQLAYSAVLEALQANITKPLADPPVAGFDLCFVNNDVVVPSFTFHFDGADLELPIDNYFVDFGEVGYCLVMAASPSGGLSIFGNFQQQNFHIVYDLLASVLSFSPAWCGALA